MHSFLIKAIKAASFAFLALFCISCADESPNQPYTLPPANPKSYVQGFYALEDIAVSPMKGLSVNETTNSISFDTSFEEDKIYSLSDGILLTVVCLGPLIDFTTNNPHNTDYWNYVEKIGDTGYNSTVRWGVLSDYPLAITDTLQSIKITCDKEFNPSSPAGSDLSGLFSVYFESPYRTVKNGYKSYEGDNTVNVTDIPADYPHTMIGGRLKGFNFIDYPFIAPMWFCALEFAPDKTASYTFTVTVDNLRGVRFTRTAKAIHIKGK